MDGPANAMPNRGAATKTRWMGRGILAAVCAIVPLVYLWSARSGPLELLCMQPADTYYNLLVRGFGSGQLSLKRDPPPGLAQVPDPYDPDATLAWRWADPAPVHDLSYFHGKLYLYFGVTPALVLFWPYAAATGHYLLHAQATVIFFAVGFLAGAVLLWRLRQQCFPETGDHVLAMGMIALGLGGGIPLVVARSDVYEVAISCGCALTMLALAALWGSLNAPRGRVFWLALASMGMGLAAGARPNLLPGAAVLLLPVMKSWRESRRLWTPLAAALGPIAVIGCGLLIYNSLRFDHWWEFGRQYQLSTDRLGSIQSFAVRNIWTNVRIYFLDPAHWTAHFPFAHAAAAPPLPAGHFRQTEYAFGILTTTPVVWMVLALPLAWQGRPARTLSLRWFAGAVALLGGLNLATLLPFFAATARYEMDFLPELLLLAIIGIFGWEHALAGQPRRRNLARAWWVSALAVSVMFSVLAVFDRHADAECRLGAILENRGRPDEALGHYRAALECNPDDAQAHSSLAVGLVRTGHPAEALAHFQAAVTARPDSAPLRYNLASFLSQNGRRTEAIDEYQKAVELQPDYFEARRKLGAALLQSGRVQEAVSNYERALEIDSNFDGAYSELCRAAWLLATSPDATLRNGAESLRFAQQAERISRGGDPLTSVTLAAAYAETGEFPLAVTSAQRALQLAEAQTNVALAATARLQVTNYQAGRLVRDNSQRAAP